MRPWATEGQSGDEGHAGAVAVARGGGAYGRRAARMRAERWSGTVLGGRPCQSGGALSRRFLSDGVLVWGRGRGQWCGVARQTAQQTAAREQALEVGVASKGALG
jgi:hypothetical protein